MLNRFIVALIFLFGCFTAGSSSVYAQSLSEFLFGQTVQPTAKTGIHKQTTAYLDSLLEHTPLRKKIGQLFFVSAKGRFTQRDSRDFLKLEELVEKYHVGGLIYMYGDIYGQAVLTNKLQQMADIPLWVSQDMEFGAAMRISGTTRITPAMGVAASRNKRNAFMMGKITAAEAKAVGVHQVYAPVLDVNNNPDNPVINVRSFSGDPNIVSEFGTSFMKGVQSEGLISTAKHFPGHGDTDTDSHTSLPIVEYDYQRLDSLELIPFRSLINEGVESIMSAHIAFPKMHNGKQIPATLDPVILNRILTDSLDFKGMIVTDGLEMKGISSKYSPGRAVVKALKAGANIMLLSPDVRTAINEVEQAVLSGELSEDIIDNSFAKLMFWKQQHGLFSSNNQVQIERLDTKISSSFYQSESRRIARESITVLKNNEDLLPILPSKYPKVVYISVADDRSGRTGNSFARALRDYHPSVSFHVYDERTSENDRRKMLNRARKADLVIIGSFLHLKNGQTVHLSGSQQHFLEKILKLRKPSLAVSFGNPYVLSDLKEADAHMLAWYNSDYQIHAATAALFGASKVEGRLPIEIPGLYELGEGIDIDHTTLRFGEPEDVGLDHTKLFAIDSLVNNAIRDSVFPGATVAIVKDGVLAYHQGYGYQDYTKLKEITTQNVYDLASITKIMATTTSVMKLIDEGKLSLDSRISEFIPEFKTPEKKSITVRDFLLHQSGLPAFRVYVDSLKTRAEIVEAIKNEPLIYETGTEYVYSDLGMILLGEIVHQISGKRLDRFARSEFYFPMNMYSTFFNPHSNSRWLLSKIPPTENDTVFHRGIVQGKVHDERSYFMDGVAGHAGLFSSAVDIAKFSTMLLNGGTYAGQQFLSPEIIAQFTAKQSKLNERGFGFDRKSETGFSTAGQLASPNTFGHTGFTGTSFWVDPDKNMAVILLTNRTFPYRSYGKRISRMRAKVADAAYSSIITQ